LALKKYVNETNTTQVKYQPYGTATKQQEFIASIVENTKVNKLQKLPNTKFSTGSAEDQHLTINAKHKAVISQTKGNRMDTKGANILKEKRTADVVTKRCLSAPQTEPHSEGKLNHDKAVKSQKLLKDKRKSKNVAKHLSFNETGLLIELFRYHPFNL